MGFLDPTDIVQVDLSPDPINYPSVSEITTQQLATAVLSLIDVLSSVVDELNLITETLKK